jgi:bacterioferritin-associated ferredoxin
VIVCLCRGVSERDIRPDGGGGANTVEAIAAASGSGGDCGACRTMLADLIVECEAAASAGGVYALA